VTPTVAAKVPDLPWGETWEALTDTVPITQTNFHFTGQREEADIGLYDYKARWYDAQLGRFVQPDTIVPEPGDPQSLNRYTYAKNNPVRFTDPTGYIAWDEQEDAMQAINFLKRTYGVEVEVDFGWVEIPNPAPGEAGRQWEEGAWELSDLYVLQQATGDVAYHLFGGAQGFRKHIGRLKVSGVEGLGAGGLTWAPYAFCIELNTEGLTKWTVAHELAHAWDQRHFGKYSSGLGVYEETGYGKDGEFKHLGEPRSWVIGPPGNRAEDWAESVAAYIYPVEARRHVRWLVNDPTNYPAWYYSGHTFRNAASRAFFVDMNLEK
jgi:RHS repeat-associated protein